MPEPYTYTKNSQINIIFNQKKENSVPMPFPIDEKISHAPLEKLEFRLKKLVGMKDIKQMVKELYAWLYVCRKREELYLKAERQSLHMLFKGNPGTGKTTVARLLSHLLAEMGVLTKGHLVEVERADLVGEYIGQTAQKTRDLVKKALGGVLFIDEAYALARGGEKDFGKEAIDTLVKQMEDHHDEFVLILAGYSEEMDDFLSINPGLPSRFPMILSFPDFTGSELLGIALQMVKERDYVLTTEAEKRLSRHLRQKALNQEMHFSNGRYVRNLVEKMIRQQAVRLVRESAFDRDALRTIRTCDLVLEEDYKPSVISGEVTGH
ncbi:AAA family ATPase [Sporolactobacillus spathodeae]|uniref:Stage V sporulation protein K n=1 Tax=Sporolactobacillus spathodeae TaxID=1465502 RepID=A0ABS2Q5M2_9BACL|nr:stage V sporulation protein K [Sporolactobacillus spathodeae]